MPTTCPASFIPPTKLTPPSTSAVVTSNASVPTPFLPAAMICTSQYERSASPEIVMLATTSVALTYVVLFVRTFAGSATPRSSHVACASGANPVPVTRTSSVVPRSLYFGLVDATVTPGAAFAAKGAAVGESGAAAFSPEQPHAKSASGTSNRPERRRTSATQEERAEIDIVVWAGGEQRGAHQLDGKRRRFCARWPDCGEMLAQRRAKLVPVRRPAPTRWPRARSLLLWFHAEARRTAESAEACHCSRAATRRVGGREP